MCAVSVPCGAAVTAEARVHEVYWEQLTGGKPDASFDPAEITNLFWTFPVPDGARTASVEAYDVDLRVDDVAFIPR
jgi:hypothetical protein